MQPPDISRPIAPTTADDVDGVLDFLWLELTNRCNLRCVHCYTESHPESGDRDLLGAEDYECLMRQARELGCRKVQLIGGEPQLNSSFPTLLRRTVELGFEFVEVFTNLTRLHEETIEFSAENRVHFATSVYSDDPAVHDAVTRVQGSHHRTITNLRRLTAHGVHARAAVISIGGDEDAVERTRRFVTGLGVSAPMRDPGVREFGRAEGLLGRTASMSALCGHCWNGSVAVAPDGRVFPCVMARQWEVGNVAEHSLEKIVRGDPLKRIRHEIHDRVWAPKLAIEPYSQFCHQSCGPDLSCPCNPLLCQQSCAPWDAVRREPDK